MYFENHPAWPLATVDPDFLAILTYHSYNCFSSQFSLRRYKVQNHRHVLLQAQAPQWSAILKAIRPIQRCNLLTRSALCDKLMNKLICYIGVYRFKNPQHHIKCMISRRNFLGNSKTHSVELFDEGQHLYCRWDFCKAAVKWGQAALLQHRASHAFLSNLLIEEREKCRHLCAECLIKQQLDLYMLAVTGASMGCSHSKGVLGRCLLDGKAVARDVCKGLALARESTAASSYFGQFVVGKCYHEGIGIARDFAEAMRWYRLSADQGFIAAQCELGHMLLFGLGIIRDYKEAKRLFVLAAEQGDHTAKYYLRNHY